MEDFEFNKIDYLILYRTLGIASGFIFFSSLMFYFEWLRNPFFEV